MKHTADNDVPEQSHRRRSFASPKSRPREAADASKQPACGSQSIGPAVRAAAALVCTLLATFSMNNAVFPQFDAIFTYARDISVLSNAALLVIIGISAMFRPALLHARTLVTASCAALAAGAVLTCAALSLGHTALLVIGSSLLALGRAVVVVFVGLSLSQLSIRTAGTAIAFAFVAAFAIIAPLQMLPRAVGVVIYLIAPLLAIGLAAPAASSILRLSNTHASPDDLSVTQPKAFLSLTSSLFICLFLFRIAFGCSLRLGEVGGAPLAAGIAALPIIVVALYVFVSKRHFPADLLTQLSALAVIAGLFFAAAGQFEYRQIAATLLSAGNTLFDMVAWLALVAIANRNPLGAIAVIAWGRGISAVGTTAGAALGVAANTLTLHNPTATVIALGAFLLVFGAYVLIGLKDFAFEKVIDGIEPVSLEVAESPEDRFEARCEDIAGEFGLTPRELEVFKMLARGRNKEYIQEKLVVSKNTVKAHVKHIYTKLDIHSHQELIDLVDSGR